MVAAVRAADDDAPFSESMLEWLEEGDRMGEAPPGGLPRPSSAHHTLESPRRRERIVIGTGVVVAAGLVLTLHLIGGKKPVTDEADQARFATAAPVASPSAPVAASPAAAVPSVAATAEPAPTPAEPAPAVAAPPPAEPAPAVAAVARVAAAPSILAATGSPPAAVSGVAPAAGADAYETAIALCRASMTAGRVARAVASCRDATAARPRSPEALTLLAEAEFTRGHTGVALHLATSATEANQNFADAYVIIGGVYQEKSKNAEARAAYEQYLALAPKGKHASDLRAILSSLPE